MTDLLAAIITLEAQVAGELDPFQGRALHALFLDLTGRADPAAATALHDSDEMKPFTSSNLSGRHALIAENSNWAAAPPAI